MHSSRAERRVATVSHRPTMVRWRVLALLMAFAFVCHFNRVSISVAGTEHIMEEYDISAVRMGTVYSSYLVMYTLCMIPGGWLIDRFGVKFALAVMGVGMGICVMATGFVGFVAAPAIALAWLLVVRSLTGVASAPMHPGAARAVAAWMPAKSRSLANGLVGASALLGIAGTYYLFGMLMEAVGWPQAFVVAGLATVLLAGTWVLYASSSPTGHQHVNVAELTLILGSTAAAAIPQEVFPWYALLRNRSLILLTFSYAAVGYFQYLFFYWVQYYFDKVLDLGTDLSRLYATLPNLAMAAGMFLGGWVADRLTRRVGARRGRSRVAICGMLAGAVFLACGVAASEPRWIALWFSCAMGAVGMAEGPFWVTAVELGGAQGGAAAAIFNTGGNLGGILAPVATPLLAEQFGWGIALPVAGLCCVLGAALWFWISPDERVGPSSKLGTVA